MGSKIFNKYNSLNENQSLDLFKNHKIEYLKDLTKDSYAFSPNVDKFCVFNSIDNILYIIYANDDKSILCYNLIDYIKINEIKNAHNSFISNIRYYFDKSNKRDLILSVTNVDNCIKLWNANKWECLLNLENIYENGDLNSACFFYYNKELYIVTSNSIIFGDPMPIKVFDLNGKKIKELKDSNDMTIFIDSYYDIRKSTYYIITGNTKSFIKTYDYKKNKIYHKYFDSSLNEYEREDDYEIKDINSVVIYDVEKILKIIEANSDGYMRIWNFHSALLLNKVEICDRDIYDMCLWNKEYLFVGCGDGFLRLINLKNMEIVEELKEHKKNVLTVKKIIHPKYGPCLITHGYNEENIKLWINKN